MPFFWIFPFFTETRTSSVGSVDTTAVTTAAPDSDVFRFLVTCISSFGIDATLVLALDLEDATSHLTGILPEMAVTSASDSESELEVVDSESDDVDSESEELESGLEELESESDELPSFLGASLRASFLSGAELLSESESDELSSFFGASLRASSLSDAELLSESESESDELSSFLGASLQASFLSDAELLSESESDPELELPLTEGFFLMTLDLTSGTLPSEDRVALVSRSPHDRVSGTFLQA